MRFSKVMITVRMVTVIVLALMIPKEAGAQYDPLAIPLSFKVKSIELTVKQEQNSRDIPIRVYLPLADAPVPVVLFSHGLGGSRDGNIFMGEHWAKRGYIAIFLQHPGSDTSVWKDVPFRERMGAMRNAASAKNLALRCEDVQATLNQLEKWNQSEGHELYRRLDLEHIGMSGHSFGAHTTQAVSGQSFPLSKGFVDKRVDAAIAFSPSSPAIGSKATAFGSVAIPWLLITGTHDVAAIGGQTAESRLEVFPFLPKSIDKFELVLKDAEHSAFTDRGLPGENGVRNPNHHKVILALSSAFWDAYLKNDQAAKAWLRNDEVVKILDPKDRWQRNFADH